MTAWIDELNSQTLRLDVSEAFNDSQFSYSEMLDFLQSVAVSGITQAELQDLRHIYDNGAFASEYVQNISYNVVYENLGNESWWGGVTNPNQRQNLGDIYAGMSQTDAERLIGKWFLGTDLPMPIAGGDTATGTAASGVYSYQTMTGALIVNGADRFDVAQGSAGTCYLIATLGAIADANPDMVSDAFIDNGNGTFGVRFYLDGQPTYVTVNRDIPVYSWGSIAFAGNPTKSLSGEMWVSLLEKAYIQLNMVDNVQADGNWLGENSYQALEGGLAYPIAQLTGLNYEYYSRYYGGSDGYQYLTTYSSVSDFKQELIDKLDAGGVGWIAAWGATYGDDGKKNLVAGHAHALLSYDEAEDAFLVRNPWGSGGSTWDGEFLVRLEDIWNTTVKPAIAVSDPGSAPISYTYTLGNDASSIEAAATEGEAISVTISRDGADTASTVYISTSNVTTSSGDFVSVKKSPITFNVGETNKIIEITTLTDVLTEDTEQFSLALFETANSSTAIATSDSFIADLPPPVLTYGVTTNSTEANPVHEGDPVTITITRSNDGVSSTVYVLTENGTTSSTDHASLNYIPVTFSSKETSKTLTLDTYSDIASETTETFSVGLYGTVGGEDALATTTAYIGDVWQDEYIYTIVSSAGSAENAVEEGGEVTFTVMRSGRGSSSSVFLDLFYDTASEDDLVSSGVQEITFGKNQSAIDIVVETSEDLWLETTESFGYNLFLSPNDEAPETYALAYISDKIFDEFNYTITNTASVDAPVAEGGKVGFTITRDGDGRASTIYISTSAGTATSGDYQALSKKEIKFASYETIKTIEIDLNTDSETEDDEYFWFDLYVNETDDYATVRSKAYISNAAADTNYTYDITSVTIDEGEDASFTITRSGQGTASSIYYKTTLGTASGDDIVEIAATELKFAAYETSKTITVKTLADQLIDEGAEYFWLDLFNTKSDAENDAFFNFGTATIQDNTIIDDDYSYTLTSNASNTAINEGDNVTFTITRNGTGGETTVYLSTILGTAGEEDFDTYTNYALTFKSYETSKTFKVATYADSESESEEYFSLGLADNLADALDGTYSTEVYAFLANVAQDQSADYSYSVTTSSDYSTPTLEGDKISFTITRDGSGSASTVYISTTAGMADDDDYAEIDKQEVTFAAYETSKTIKVSTFTDGETEGDEYFYLDLFKTYVDAKDGFFHAYATAYIGESEEQNGASEYSYSITSSAQSDPAIEGDDITFTITRDSSGTASTIYITTTFGSADDDDFAAFEAKEITFKDYETSKTVKVETFEDLDEEGQEYFWLDLFKTYADAQAGNFFTYATANIDDGEAAQQDSYSYEVSASSDDGTPVSEGGMATVTITRDASGTSSTVYISTTSGSADDTDYMALEATALTFKPNETSKTVNIEILTDFETEGDEYFYIDVYKTYADALNGNFVTYGTVDITDAAEEEVIDYTFSIETDNANGVSEGEDVVFTITRDNSRGDVDIYVTTTMGSTDHDDLKTLDKKKISFADGELSKILNVETYKDNDTEGSEYFWLDLFKTYADAQNGNFADYAVGYINDSQESEEPSDFTISLDTVDEAPILEGQTAAIIITRDNDTSAETVYISTTSSTAGDADYEALDKLEVSFAVGETSQTIDIQIWNDDLIEDDESFFVDLYLTYSDALDSQFSDYAYVTILDQTDENVSPTTYVYSVVSSASYSSPAIEGEDITFTITRDTADTSDTIYYSTTESGAEGDEDYEDVFAQPLTFSAGELTKTVTISTLIDDEDEGLESFWLDLFESYDDANDGAFMSYGAGYITDGFGGSDNGGSDGGGSGNLDYTYTIQLLTNNPVEGSGVDVEITRDSSVGQSTIYISTYDGSAEGDVDFEGVYAEPITFQDGQSTATYTIETYSDDEADDNESFWIDIYLTESDAELINPHDYISVLLQDSGSEQGGGDENYGEGGVFYYVISSNASYTPAIEGEDIEITIIRSGDLGADFSQSSTIYLSTTFSTYGYDNDAADIDDLETAWDGYAVTFSANETIKNLYITTAEDFEYEVEEFFYIDLFLSMADAATGTYDDYTLAYIIDAGSAYAIPAAAAAQMGNTTITVDTTANLAFPGHSLTEFRNDYAFAAIDEQGNVISWGNNLNGGNSEAASAELSGVASIHSNSRAFAAIHDDGSVSVWGNADTGGVLDVDTAAALNGTIDVSSISSTRTAFAALRADGSVITWGATAAGGDQADLDLASGVVAVYSNLAAFAALKSDGSVIAWGNADYGGTNDYLDIGVTTKIFSSGSAFAAVLQDGSVWSWGNALGGGDLATVSDELDGRVKVTTIASTSSAFAALRQDGSVITWGDFENGGQSKKVATALNGTNDVVSIYSTYSAFAALHVNGAVTVWGNAALGGEYDGTALNGTNPVTFLTSNGAAFMAIHQDGSLTSWGADGYGGDSSSVQSLFDGSRQIDKVVSSEKAFTVLFTDGSITSWGEFGDDDPARIENLIENNTDIIDIYATKAAFSAIKQDGSIISWGGSEWGGQADADVGGVVNIADILNDIIHDIVSSNVDTELSGTLLRGLWSLVPFVNQGKVIFELGASGSSDYLIDGLSDPDITLVRGKTYVFDKTSDGHPFYIKTALSSGTSKAYNDGVINNGGDNALSDIEFTVPLDAPDTLYYQCSVHPNMNGTLTIIDNPWAGRSFTATINDVQQVLDANNAGDIDLSAYVGQTISLETSLAGGVAGSVDLLDVLAVLDHVSGTSAPLAKNAFVAGNVNASDDEIDLIDALQILDIIASETDATLVFVNENYERDFSVSGADLALQSVVLGDVLGNYVEVL